MKTTTDYNQKAIDFLSKTNAKIKIEYSHFGEYFNGDQYSRNVYNVCISRNKKRYSFTFGDSVSNSKEGKEPSEYDILTCLTKYDVGSFENFCSDFGYDENLAISKKTYKAVLREYAGVCRIWNEKEIEELAEIQ